MTWGELVTEIGGTLFRLNHLPQKKIIVDKVMTKADEFRAKADKYERKARQVQDAEANRLLLEAAQNYSQLAALAKRRGW